MSTSVATLAQRSPMCFDGPRYTVRSDRECAGWSRRMRRARRCRGGSGAVSADATHCATMRRPSNRFLTLRWTLLCRLVCPLCASVSHKKSKLHGKSLEHRRNAQKAADAKEVAELNKRIAQETPPKGVSTQYTQTQTRVVAFGARTRTPDRVPVARVVALCSHSELTPLRLRLCVPSVQSNPLSLDRPSDSFTPGSADAADESAAGASTPAAAASSGEATPRNANKAAKQAARANASGGNTVLYGAVRKFSELPISARTLQALTDASFTRLTDIQRAAIPHALAGRDILGAARTGSGKTLAYLVPVLERLYRERWGKLDGVGALIIVPTRELAMQIFDVLRSSVGKTHAYSAGLIIGGKDLAEEQERIGGMNILICTPGRILQHCQSTTQHRESHRVESLRACVLTLMYCSCALSLSRTNLWLPMRQPANIGARRSRSHPGFRFLASYERHHFIFA